VAEVDGRIAQIAQLVGELHRFCVKHESGDRAAAAADMLAYLQEAKTGAVSVDDASADPTKLADPESLALGLVRDVGELAAMLIDAEHPEVVLAWGRSSLVAHVELYRAAIQDS
jgi:hypothetical protein